MRMATDPGAMSMGEDTQILGRGGIVTFQALANPSVHSSNHRTQSSYSRSQTTRYISYLTVSDSRRRCDWRGWVAQTDSVEAAFEIPVERMVPMGRQWRMLSHKRWRT